MTDTEAELDRFIARFTPEVATLGRGTIAWLRARLPGAMVLVYDNFNALAVGFSPTEKSSQGVFSVALYPRWINFFFLQAVGNLDDPAGLLKGSGSVVRHVTLGAVGDLETPAMTALIDQALATAKLPFDPAGEGRVIFKAVAEKQRPRRPGSA